LESQEIAIFLTHNKSHYETLIRDGAIVFPHKFKHIFQENLVKGTTTFSHILQSKTILFCSTTENKIDYFKTIYIDKQLKEKTSFKKLK